MMGYGLLRAEGRVTLGGMGFPDKTYGPFPANVPENERFAQPRPDHQDVERQRSGGLADSPPDMPPMPVGPTPYSPTRLR